MEEEPAAVMTDCIKEINQLGKSVKNNGISFLAVGRKGVNVWKERKLE